MTPFSKVAQDETDNFVEDAIDEGDNIGNLEISNGTSTEERNYSRHFCKYRYISPKVLYIVGCVALATVAFMFAYPAFTSGEVEPEEEEKEKEWTPILMSSEDIDLSKLDTNRKAISFHSTMSAGTYHQFSDIYSKSDMGFQGMQISTIQDIQISNLLTISEIEGGIKEIESTVTKMDMDTSSMGQKMEYHSETDGDNPEFQMINQFIGQTNTIRVDKYGKVVYSSVGQDLLESIQDQSDGLTTKEQYSQMTRMSKALPQNKSVKPNDKWEFQMELDEHVAPFDGTTTLLGYTTYDGADVAVLEMDAALPNMDMGGLDFTDDTVKNILSQTKTKDGHMTGFMFWDTKDNFPRWIDMDVTLIVDMTVAGVELEVPVVEKIVTYAHH